MGVLFVYILPLHGTYVGVVALLLLGHLPRWRLDTFTQRVIEKHRAAHVWAAWGGNTGILGCTVTWQGPAYPRPIDGRLLLRVGGDLVGAGTLLGEVWGSVSVRLVVMCCSGWWVCTEGNREGQDAHIRRILDQTKSKLQGQQLCPQASVLLQQTQDPPLQHHVIGPPPFSGPLGGLVVFSSLVPVAIVFLLAGDELPFAAYVIAAVFIAAAASLRFSALSVLEQKGATQEAPGSLAGGGQDGNGFIGEGLTRPTQRSGPKFLLIPQGGHRQVPDDGSHGLTHHAQQTLQEAPGSVLMAPPSVEETQIHDEELFIML